MGFADALSAEDRVPVKFTDFYNLMKQATFGELLLNAAKCDVPSKYIVAMATGKIEKEDAE